VLIRTGSATSAMTQAHKGSRATACSTASCSEELGLSRMCGTVVYRFTLRQNSICMRSKAWRVAAASSPAATCKQDAELTSLARHACGCARPSRARLCHRHSKFSPMSPYTASNETCVHARDSPNSGRTVSPKKGHAWANALQGKHKRDRKAHKDAYQLACTRHR
jgi:hypothetical protein